MLLCEHQISLSFLDPLAHTAQVAGSSVASATAVQFQLPGAFASWTAPEYSHSILIRVSAVQADLKESAF